MVNKKDLKKEQKKAIKNEKLQKVKGGFTHTPPSKTKI